MNMATALWAIGAMVVCSVFSAMATFFLKLAAPKMSFNIVKLIRNWKLIIGLFLYGIGTIIALFALRGGELSILYPVVALQYVWTNIISKIYLSEKITLLKWIGVACIIIGVSIIGLKA